MSYWVFPESGIPISVTTIQGLTTNERNTDEMKCRMERYDKKLTALFDTQGADISQSLCDIDSNNVIDPDNEDPAFYKEFTRKEFTRIIDDATLPHADDKKTTNVEVISDNYIGMEFALPRGDEGEIDPRYSGSACCRISTVRTSGRCVRGCGNAG